MVLVAPIELYLNSPALLSTGPREFNITGRVVSTDPRNACTSLTVDAELQGNIVVIDDGECNFERQGRNVQALGAIVGLHWFIRTSFTNLN